VWRTDHWQVFIASSLGGVVVAYGRDASGWRLAFEDSGYLFSRNGQSWVTRMPGAGAIVERDEQSLTVCSRFARVLHDELTPPRMVALRILNLTVLRFQWIGDVFRKLVVGRLMADRAWLPLTLTRRVGLEADQLLVGDIVEAGSHIPGRMWRCRRLTGAHMASSRYFQGSELQSLGSWRAPVAWDGRRWTSGQIEVGR